MNRILEVDLPNARVVVEPGVINLDVTPRRSAELFLRARSFVAIGVHYRRKRRGKLGGAHCLKYGFTTTHVLGSKWFCRTARW
jgi:glycolate oxidase